MSKIVVDESIHFVCIISQVLSVGSMHIEVLRDTMAIRCWLWGLTTLILSIIAINMSDKELIDLVEVNGVVLT